jgi:uncharacterized protein (DUF4415 family)
MPDIRGFQWDARKSALNLEKHGIDFDEAAEVFYRPHALRRSDRNKKERWVAIGESEQRIRPSRSRIAATRFGSSQHDARDEMKNERIVKRKWGERRRGKTDWARVDALTDEEIAEAVRNDPDAVALDFDWSDAILVIPPKKKPISIRVDEDVLDFFKTEGAGYQRRMNAVLRSYMQQKRKPKKRA